MLITHEGKVTIVDMDSVQISEGEKLLFPGTAATPNYIPPEFYNKGVGKASDVPLNESWDNFALGVVFYQVLFGLHPYVVTPWVQKDPNCSEIFQNIEQNLFPYGPNGQKIKSYPPLHKKFGILPAQLKQLFLNAFSSTESLRPGADEWGQTIHEIVLAAGPAMIPQAPPRTQPQPTPAPVSETPSSTHPKSLSKKSNITLIVVLMVINIIIYIITHLLVNN